MKSFAPLLLAAAVTGCAAVPKNQAPQDLAPKLSVAHVGQSEFIGSAPLTRDAFLDAGAFNAKIRTDLECARDRDQLGTRGCRFDVQVRHNGTTALDVLEATLVVNGERVVVPAKLVEFGVDSCSPYNCQSTSYLSVPLEKRVAYALMEENVDPTGSFSYQLGHGEIQFVGRVPNTVIQAMAYRVARP